MAIETRINQSKIVFGDWEVQEYIGSGSGGKTAVFRIVRKHEGWEEQAALKVINILEEIGKKEELAETYLTEYEAERTELCKQAENELRLMAHLKGNAHIVEYYDALFVDYQEENTFGTDLLIRMELLESLQEERKKKGEYTEAEVIKIGRDICQGLSFCHEKGVIHRDIKPGNIFVTQFGGYKLGDFGIARMVDAGQKASTKMGTRAYAAPEQFMVNAGKYDNRVDIYSLGLTLYELLNHNRLPFAGSAYVRESEIQMRIMGKEFPSPENANPALGEVIKKACAYEVEGRYASVEDFEEALMAAEVGVLPKKEASDTKKNVPSKKMRTKEGKQDKLRGEKKRNTQIIPVAAVGVLLVLLLVLLGVGIRELTKKDSKEVLNADNTGQEVVSGSEQEESPEPEVEIEEEENLTVEESDTEIESEESKKLTSEDYEAIFGKAAYVTAEGESIAVITQEGDLYMWGDNEYGQVGCGNTTYQEKPVFIMSDVESVELSGTHSAAITKNGDLYVWGSNKSGGVGNNSDMNQMSPTLLMCNVKSVELEEQLSCALCNNGDLYRWGTSSNIKLPVKIAKNIEKFSISDRVGGAVTTDGDLYMWGRNLYGQVGNGTTENVEMPVKIMSKVDSVCIGDSVSAAVTTDGDLYMWGYSGFGQLGVGNQKHNRSLEIYEPTYVMSNVESVYLKADHSAAITTDGDLYMWGCNYTKQVGLSSDDRYWEPQIVCKSVESVELGERHTAVLRGNGDLYMWGANNTNQILANNLQSINAPTWIESDIVSVGLGQYTTYAVGSDGSFYSWGE